MGLLKGVLYTENNSGNLGTYPARFEKGERNQGDEEIESRLCRRAQEQRRIEK